MQLSSFAQIASGILRIIRLISADVTVGSGTTVLQRNPTIIGASITIFDAPNVMIEIKDEPAFAIRAGEWRWAS